MLAGRIPGYTLGRCPPEAFGPRRALFPLRERSNEEWRPSAPQWLRTMVERASSTCNVCGPRLLRRLLPWPLGKSSLDTWSWIVWKGLRNPPSTLKCGSVRVAYTLMMSDFPAGLPECFSSGQARQPLICLPSQWSSAELRTPHLFSAEPVAKAQSSQVAQLPRGCPERDMMVSEPAGRNGRWNHVEVPLRRGTCGIGRRPAIRS